MPFNSVPRARSISRRAQFDRSTRAREVLNVDGLQVNVLRKKNRNMYLRVKPPYGAIEVTAPVRMPQHTIVEFVRERRSWVDEALHKMAQARSRTFASPDLDPDVGGSRTTVLRDARDPGSPRMETPHETSSFTPFDRTATARFAEQVDADRRQISDKNHSAHHDIAMGFVHAENGADQAQSTTRTHGSAVS